MADDSDGQDRVGIRLTHCPVCERIDRHTEGCPEPDEILVEARARIEAKVWHDYFRWTQGIPGAGITWPGLAAEGRA